MKENEIINHLVLPNHTILIVEDDPFCVEIMKHSLSDTKAKIIHAETGKKAIEIISTQHVDIIFLDIQLPILNGFEVLKQIRDLRKDIPVIAHTLFAFHKEREKIFNAGFNDLVIKPITTKCLIDIINKHVKTFHLEDESITMGIN